MAAGEAIEALIEHSGEHERVAVFDADGTLWAADASERFLDWIDERGLVPPPPGSSSLLAHSDKLCAQSRPTGYSWAAQAMAGQLRGLVQGWAEASFDERVREHIFPATRSVLGMFQRADWDVWIVSASPRWVLLPGARALGVPADRILAIDVEQDGDVLTDRVLEPVTTGQGKVARIRRDIGREPAFVCGNSVDDVPMLGLATGVGLVINPGTLHGVPTDLEATAHAKGWHVIRATRTSRSD